MKNRPPLSKAQLALLRSIDAASRMIGTPGIATTNLAGRIARHYFRPDRAEGALRELRRSENLILLVRDRYRVVIAPPSAQDCLLPGYEPEPLSQESLAAMIRESGAAVTVEFPSIPRPVPVPNIPSMDTPQWTRRLRLLANHRVAEIWYGDALPPEFSSAVVTVNQPDPRFFLALRYKLASERLMETFRMAGRYNVRTWRVSSLGVDSYVRNAVTASLSAEEAATIAASLGLAPLSNQPGC